MTLPSLRKLPTTPSNTPTFVDRRRSRSAAFALLAPALLGLELGLSGLDRAEGAEAVLAANVRGGHAPWSEPVETTPTAAAPQPALTAKPKPNRAPTAKGSAVRSAASKTTGGASAARTVRTKPKRKIQPAAFEADEVGNTAGAETRPAGEAYQEFDDRAAAVPALPQEDDGAGVEALEASPASPSHVPVGHLAKNTPYDAGGVPATEVDTEARRARVREQLTRPFKQMREIHPFFDYEPDPEQIASDRCHNLCPRPGSPDCPDCEEPGPDGVPQGRLMCPECPIEIDLRDTARMVGSLNDFPSRNFPHMHYCWEPTNLYSYPLYFEDHCLERYGHTRHYVLQAPVSVGLFAVQVLGLPYQMTIDPIAKKRYALGWYRPGQYVPYKYYQIPWNTEAALVEAGVIAGSYFLFAPGVGP